MKDTNKSLEELQKAIYATKHFDEIMPLVEKALTSYGDRRVKEEREKTRLTTLKWVKLILSYKSIDEVNRLIAGDIKNLESLNQNNA